MTKTPKIITLTATVEDMLVNGDTLVKDVIDDDSVIIITPYKIKTTYITLHEKF